MECYADQHPKESKIFVCSKKDENQFFSQSSFGWSFWTSIIHSFQFNFVQFFSLWLICIPSIYHMAGIILVQISQKTWSFENTKPELKSLNFQWWQYFNCHPNLCGFLMEKFSLKYFYNSSKLDVQNVVILHCESWSIVLVKCRLWVKISILWPCNIGNLANCNSTVIFFVSSHSLLKPLKGLVSVFSWVKFRQISTWKTWFRTIQRIFHEKNGPNSPYFKEKKSNSPYLW